MTAQVIRVTAKLFFAAILVSLVCIGCDLLVPGRPSVAFAFLCVTFAALGASGSRTATLAAVVIGALELALLLPGEGFAVSNSDDALGLIGTVATGLLIAWYAGRSEARAEVLDGDLALARKNLDGSRALLDEMSHRVANDMQLLVAIIQLQSNATSSPQARQVLAVIGDRMVILGRIYRRLGTTINSGHSGDAKQFLGDLCSDFLSAFSGLRPVAFELDLEEVVLPFDQLVIIGVVLNELLTNVYKHAFPDDRAGHVTVALARHDDHGGNIELVVADDGVGPIHHDMPNERIGQKLMASIAAQLHGTITYSRIDTFTIVKLRFPAGVPANRRRKERADNVEWLNDVPAESPLQGSEKQADDAFSLKLVG